MKRLATYWSGRIEGPGRTRTGGTFNAELWTIRVVICGHVGTGDEISVALNAVVILHS
jgi:hypothetical protein